MTTTPVTPTPALDEISQDHTPLTPTLLRHVVDVASRAPSLHNTQPWLFTGDGTGLDVFADRSRQLVVVDPIGRQLHISVGAAVHHAALALHGLGRAARVTLLPDLGQVDQLARLDAAICAELPTADDWALLNATSVRHTHRQHFEQRRVTRGVLADLVAAASSQGAHLRLVERPGERRACASLVAEATRRQEADPSYQREIAHWIRRDGDAPDGVPRSVAAAPRRGVAHDEFIQRDFHPYGEGEWAPQRPAEHPDIAVLWTARDTRHDWLQAGMALSAVLLTATCAGVGVSMLNQPIEIPALRQKLRAELELRGAPQLVLRLGYGVARTGTGRRPLAQVLREAGAGSGDTAHS